MRGVGCNHPCPLRRRFALADAALHLEYAVNPEHSEGYIYIYIYVYMYVEIAVYTQTYSAMHGLRLCTSIVTRQLACSRPRPAGGQERRSAAAPRRTQGGPRINRKYNNRKGMLTIYIGTNRNRKDSSKRTQGGPRIRKRKGKKNRSRNFESYKL